MRSAVFDELDELPAEHFSTELEVPKETRETMAVIMLQAHARGFLVRRKLGRRKSGGRGLVRASVRAGGVGGITSRAIRLRRKSRRRRQQRADELRAARSAAHIQAAMRGRKARLTVVERPVVVRALHALDTGSPTQEELSLEAGDLIRCRQDEWSAACAQPDGGWVAGTLYGVGFTERGLFPSNYAELTSMTVMQILHANEQAEEEEEEEEEEEVVVVVEEAHPPPHHHGMAERMSKLAGNLHLPHF